MTKLRAVVVFVGAMSAAAPAGAQEAPFQEALRPVRVLPGAHVHADGSITLHPTRSQANLVNIQCGVTFGPRAARA
jgi:hypothetical protein